MNSDLFSKNLDDLPDEVRNNLKLTAQGKILALFDIKQTLTIDDVVIGLYRKYKAVYKRQSVVTYLHLLRHKGLISIPKRGVFVKNEQ